MKKTGYLLLLCSFVILLAVINDYVTYYKSSDGNKLQNLWSQDLQILKTHKKLPKNWDSIKEVQLFSGPDKASGWVKELEPPIQINPKGHLRLEVLVLSWSEGRNHGAIIQYDLIDSRSGNLLWELGRTFKFR